jgi:hypothetical protein
MMDIVFGEELASPLVAVMRNCQDNSPFECSDTSSHVSGLSSGGETDMEVTRRGRIWDKCIAQALK